MDDVAVQGVSHLVVANDHPPDFEFVVDRNALAEPWMIEEYVGRIEEHAYGARLGPGAERRQEIVEPAEVIGGLAAPPYSHLGRGFGSSERRESAQAFMSS